MESVARIRDIVTAFAPDLFRLPAPIACAHAAGNSNARGVSLWPNTFAVAPVSPIKLLIGVFVFALLFGLIQVGALTIAFDKLDLSMGSAMLLIFSSLIGSNINLPLFTIDAEPPAEGIPPMPRGPLDLLLPRYTGKTLIAVNVGGAVIPVAFSIYLLTHRALPGGEVILAIALQAAVCYLMSRPIPGLGVGMPVLVAPITAAIIAVTMNPAQSAPLAYVCGTLGVLVGADLMRLKDIRRLGTPLASIGGAGTFDGVFITGIVAVLLA